MNSPLSAQHLEQITIGIQEKYEKVAVTPEGQFTYPTGREGLTGLGYDVDLIASLPDAVADSFCGVGNPFSLGKIGPGSRVLDIGCGAGVDALLASALVGASGEVLGIDLTQTMIDCANGNKEAMEVENIRFQVSNVQKLTGLDGYFDFIISNGVFNLIPEKEQALAAALRLLKPGGKLFMADQFLIGRLTKDLNARVATWFQWEGGAVPEMDFLATLETTGFIEVEKIGATGFNSSPKTKGILVRARKPLEPMETNQSPTKAEATDGETGGLAVDVSEKKIITTSTFSSFDHIVKRALEMGAEKAKVIETDSIVVDKWVKWKCIYGCPMFGKDGYHPPMTPDIDEVKEVMGEYTKAILINGEDGRLLTEIACRLEGEAYHSGYYKSFALTALSAGTGVAPESAASTWPTGNNEAPCEPAETEVKKINIRPMMEACGIDVFQTARNNGFKIDTRKETYGRWNYFALVLIE